MSDQKMREAYLKGVKDAEAGSTKDVPFSMMNNDTLVMSYYKGYESATMEMREWSEL